MAEQSVRGRFVWHDLITPDQKAAAAFYSDALGWQSAAWDQEPSYLLFQGANGPLGGALEEAQATPHWLPFIGTEDLDAAVGAAERLGGTVRTPPTELPNGGRYALLADPQGAAFGVHWSAAEQPPPGAPGVGEFSWHELVTSDSSAALEFYQALFGWEKVREHGMGDMGAYLIFGRDGAEWGGVYTRDDSGAAAHWLAYVRVDDLDGAVERAKASRGSVLAGPMDVPNGDRVAQLMDPHGAFFAVHLQAADIPAAKPEPEQAAPKREAAAKPAKKPAKKAAAKKKAAGKKAKTAGKKAQKKTAKKAAKKSAKKGAKKATRKAGKKTARKVAKKGVKKAAKKSATGMKKKAAKKTAKKAAAKKAGRKTGKKTAKKSGKKAAKKSAARGNKRPKAAKKKRTRARRPAKKARR